MILTHEQITEFAKKVAELRTWHVPVRKAGEFEPQILIVRDASKEHAAQVAASIAKLQGWTVTGEPVEFTPVRPVEGPERR